MSRILVIGSGAIGGLVGALLREARHDVLLIGRGEQVRAVTLDGLRLTGKAYGEPRAVPVPIATRAPSSFRPDLVVLAVKTQDVESALKEHGDTFGDAPVVATQNGLAQDDAVASFVGRARTVSAIVALDATHVRAGEVRCDRKGTLLIGAPFAESQSAARVALSILDDGVRSVWADDVRGARWTKVIVNLANAVPAITGLTYQDAARHPRLGIAHVRMIREGLAVAAAEGATLRPIPWTSPTLLRTVTRLPDGLAKRVYAMRVKRVLGSEPAYGSTWQSMERGRPVEVEWLNGEVVRRGLALQGRRLIPGDPSSARGVPTPVNAAAVRLVLAGKRLSPDEAARALLA